MQKKVAILLICITALAAVCSWAATTYQIQTKLTSYGGTLQVRDRAVQTAVNTVVFNNFTTSAPVPVTVTASAGYKISSLTRNGVAVQPLTNITTHYTTSFVKSGGITQTLVAGFAAKPVPVTTQVSGPGSITPSNPSVSYNGSVTLQVAPSFTNGVITAVTVNGAPYTGASFPYRGLLNVTLNNVVSPTTVSASFDNVTMSLCGNQVAATNAPVALKGTVTGPATFSWNLVKGPGSVNAESWTTLTPSFTPPGPGEYTFSLTAWVGSTSMMTASTNVTIVDDVAAYFKTECFGCHAAGGVDPRVYVYTGWTSSKHRFYGVNCVTCHTDGAMPTPVSGASVDKNTYLATSASAAPVGSIYCSNCHVPGAVHKTPGMLCSNCHSSAANHNFDTSFAARVNVCFSCHGGVNTTHFYSASSIPTTQCVLCHNAKGHAPQPSASVTAAHFNGYTSPANPAYAAAYVTPSTSCADCHQWGDPTSAADAALLPYRQQWAASGHGNVNDPAWKNTPTRNWKASGTYGANAKASAGTATDCQRCHAASGYLKFAQLTSIAPAAASARYSEPLACNACHTSGDFSTPRSFGARTGLYNYSSSLTGRIQLSRVYPDAGRSNICLGCHVGRASGGTINAIVSAISMRSYSTSFWQDVAFIDAHYLSAGGQVYGTTGYHYPGVDYANGGVNHATIGSDNGAGPCVACHMPNWSHTLDTSAGSFALCGTCHVDGRIGAASLEAKSSQFAAALKALAAALSAKGFAPGADGSFGYTSWGTARTAPGTMGAAFNYTLLSRDPGAFAHNPTYVKRLVRDSIDFLVNGDVNRGRDLSAAIDALLPDGSDQESATAYLANAGSGSAACSVCHQGSTDKLTGHNILEDYNASKHALTKGGATCVDCHASGTAATHPPNGMLSVPAEISANCLKCHPLHTWDSKGKCINCHNGHSTNVTQLGFPHYNNLSSNTLPAGQYVTTNLSCDNCHTAVDSSGTYSFNIYSANVQWARSGKGAPQSASWTSYDFKTMGSLATPATSAAPDCVRCHTTTGYVNYVSSGFRNIQAWGAAGDRTREMVACSSCHYPTPFKSFDGDETDDWGDLLYPAFSRREVPMVTGYFNYSGGGSPRVLKRALFEDLGASNNCIVCHSGTRAGITLKQIAKQLGTHGDSAPFWNNTPFIDPHGMGAAGIMFAKTGYTYPVTRARNYNPSHGFAHPYIDDSYGGGQGACIACHLYTERPHLFKPVSSASNGTIAKINAYDDVCSWCHERGSQPIDLSNSANLNTKKQQFVSSLKALTAALAAKNVYFNPDVAPYFFNVPDKAQQGPEATWYKSWNAYYDPTTGAFAGMDLMGAAFNLRLLWSDPGAYTHNSYYTKRLIYDSIDFLDDGAMNSSVYRTLTNMGTLPDTDRNGAIGYIGTRP